MEFIKSIANWFNSKGWAFLFTIILLISFFFLIKLLSWILRKVLYAIKVDDAVTSFYSSLLSTVLWIIAIFICASILEIDTSYFIVALSGAAVAIGLALKDSLGNLASGILIIYNKPFKRGDFVLINGVEGIVQNIKLLTTELLTYDNQKIIFPNNIISTNAVINYTNLSTRRLDMVFSVSYGSDLDLVEKALKEVADNDKRVLKKPDYTIKLQKHNSSGLDYAFRVWVKTQDYWDVYWDMPRKVYDVFLKYNIVIPFNVIDVRLNNGRQDEK